MHNSYNYFHIQGVLCKDRSKYCKDWANDGRCDTDRWVYDNCLKSCKRFTVCDRYMIKPIGKFVVSCISKILGPTVSSNIFQNLGCEHSWCHQYALTH